MDPHDLNALWARHNAEWRDPAQIASQWREATDLDPNLLRYTTRGDWWGVLARLGITLLVTREYEHLAMGITVTQSGPLITYMPLPHPSGLVIDRARNVVYIASTRNPNQVYDFEPVAGVLPRRDVEITPPRGQPLVPVRSRFFAGSLYMHDMALIGTKLYANAVGQNAVVRLHADGRWERVWWPRCIETKRGPIFGQNHIQLNSIAAGANLAASFFSASTDRVSARRPGHKNFSVDRRGVIFSGKTREPIARGLTRPHSARLYTKQIWVDDSGYGGVGFIEEGKFHPVAVLPGWTRGLCFCDTVAFVGTSRVIPRFRCYAPGLDVDTSECGVYALDTRSGQILGSLVWPWGNQIFALDWIAARVTWGFPFRTSRRATAQEKKLFYTFNVGQIANLTCTK